MPRANDLAAILYQNLIDAGCDENTTQKCISFAENGRYDQLLRALSQHRSSLLDAVHCGQKQLDCLDYLIYQIDKKKI